jgi:hypothetical protein
VGLPAQVGDGSTPHLFGRHGNALAVGQSSIAFGSGTIAAGIDAVALGTSSTATGLGAIALGSLSWAGNAGDVALGSNSVTAAAVATAGTTIAGTAYSFAGVAPTSTVSVGDVGSERTITNVAAGRLSSTSTDAVNGSQLYATNQAITNVNSQLTHYVSVNDGGVQQANYNNSGATGSGSIAIGIGATADNLGNPATPALAIGFNATASGTGIALGNGANGNGGIAIGQGAYSGNGNQAIGTLALARGVNTVAVGTSAGGLSAGLAGLDGSYFGYAAGQRAGPVDPWAARHHSRGSRSPSEAVARLQSREAHRRCVARRPTATVGIGLHRS